MSAGTAVPKVSVLIITYNHEQYIAQAVESALAQQARFPFEVVIGEDCSTDRTLSVLQDLAEQHPIRLRLLARPKNLGMMANVADTLQQCQGEYVALLEGDDFWTSTHKLQVQADQLDRSPGLSLSFHKVVYQYEDQSRPSHEFPVLAGSTFGLEDIATGNFIQTCSVMFRRRLLPRLPDWMLDLHLGDWPLCMVLACHGSLGFLQETMAVYRVHSGGAWSGRSETSRLFELRRMFEAASINLPQSAYALTRQLASTEYALAVALDQEGQRDPAREMLRSAVGHFLNISRSTNEPPDMCLINALLREKNARRGGRSIEDELAELRAIKDSASWRLTEGLRTLPLLKHLTKYLASRKSATANSH